MQTIGITGGLASGKTTVARWFHQQGAPVADADALARQVLLPTTPVYQTLVEWLGEEILAVPRAEHKGLRIDPRKLAARLFADARLRAQVEALMHPAIWSLFLAQAEQWKNQGASLIFYEAALLVETGRYRELSGLVVVDVPEALQYERAQQRGMREEEVRVRINAQTTRQERLRAATWVIDNSGPLEQTYQQLTHLWHNLLEQKQPCE